MRHLRRAAREIIDGFRAGLDLLSWGRVYPRMSPALVARLVTPRNGPRDPGSGT